MKQTHRARIIMAAVAVLIFFVTIWFEMTGQPLDFRQPGLAAGMLAFLVLGLASLVYTWIDGPDTSAERFITVFMVGLHIIFDTYIFVRVFVLDMDLPVALVQGVVEAYWLSGLLDVYFLYRERNKQLVDGTYTSPQQQIATLQMQLQMQSDTIERQQDTIEKQERSLIDAKRDHRVICEDCGWTKVYQDAESAERGLVVHQAQWCKGSAANPNGRQQPKEAEHGD